MKNAYDILGIPSGSSQEAIKKAFHSLAHKHHPDKVGGSAERFKEVSAAYAQINTPDKQRDYDSRMGTGYRPAQQAQNPWGQTSSQGRWNVYANDPRDQPSADVLREMIKRMFNEGNMDINKQQQAMGYDPLKKRFFNL